MAIGKMPLVQNKKLPLFHWRHGLINYTDSKAFVGFFQIMHGMRAICGGGGIIVE
jgi:hypothetical protein